MASKSRRTFLSNLGVAASAAGATLAAGSVAHAQTPAPAAADPHWQARESEFAAKMAEYQTNYPELKFGSYPRMIGGGWEVRIRVRGRPRELRGEGP